MSSTTDSQVLPAAPSLIKSLMAGFDVASNHIHLILFPLVLDLFLWLGPRVSLLALVQSFFDRAGALPEMNTPEMVEMMDASRKVWLALLEHFNLLSVLRTFPVGIPSLMVSRSPAASPLGAAVVWEAPWFGAVAAIWLVTTLTGLAAGALYFGVVAQASLAGKVSWREAAQRWPWACLQVFFLALIWLALLIMVSVPFSCLLSLLMITGLGVGRMAVFVYGGLLAWLLRPMVFSPHGIFVHGHNVLVSIREGIRLVRLSLPATGLLFLMILILSEGLDVLWRIPGESSWLSLVGVAGHAFVTTGLLAASFVYYRDIERWSQKMIQQAKFSSLMKA